MRCVKVEEVAESLWVKNRNLYELGISKKMEGKDKENRKGGQNNERGRKKVRLEGPG